MVKNKYDVLQVVKDYEELKKDVFEYARENKIFDKTWLRIKDFDVNIKKETFLLIMEDYLHGEDETKTYIIPFNDFLEYQVKQIYH